MMMKVDWTQELVTRSHASYVPVPGLTLAQASQGIWPESYILSAVYPIMTTQAV